MFPHVDMTEGTGAACHRSAQACEHAAAWANQAADFGAPSSADVAAHGMADRDRSLLCIAIRATDHGVEMAWTNVARHDTFKEHP